MLALEEAEPVLVVVDNGYSYQLRVNITSSMHRSTIFCRIPKGDRINHQQTPTSRTTFHGRSFDVKDWTTTIQPMEK
jgi:hypothetical protein